MGLTVPVINYSSFSTLPLDLSSSSKSSSINIQSKINQLLTKFLKNDQNSSTIINNNNNNNERLPFTQPYSSVIIPTKIEQSVAYQYANEKRLNAIKQTSNSSHLRRLQSKPKLHPISIESKSPISSSIAQRIESLKKSMHHSRQLDVIEPVQSPVLSSTTNLAHKQTQTTDLQLNACELHHIHHHHIHSPASSWSFSWRICLFLLGFCCLISLFLIEFITIYF